MSYKKFLPDVLMVALFAVISLAYFWNPIMDGLVLTGTDHNAAVGSNVELNEYRKAHNGERTRWTNSLFSGMPTYQMAPSYDSTDTLAKVEKVYQLGLPEVAGYVFMMLLGFYILLRAFDFRQWMAALGAILWAFSSYYFIIIAAGHIWKLLTLCFIPPTIAGMVLCYRGKYLWGILVTGIFTALQVFSNHIQMSYYFLLVMLLMAGAYLVESLKLKIESSPYSEANSSAKQLSTFNFQLSTWFKGSLAALVGGLLGVSINISNLYHTYEYSKETMRGKSELTQKTKDAADQTDSGLERSYITHYSYGVSETWTLLVPNIKGGGSGNLLTNPDAQDAMRPEYRDIYRQFGGLNQYWGGEEGTVGPVYVGAFVLMLFVLGLFVVRGPMKWALLVATVLSITLAWGRNWQWLTDLAIDYLPMYSKFRAVESILVIAEFTIPLLAMFTLKRFYDEPDLLTRSTRLLGLVEVKNTWLVALSFVLTGGVALLFYIYPSLAGSAFIEGGQEYAVLNGYVEQGMPRGVLDNIAEMRYALVRPDAMRSFLLVVVGTALLLCYCYRKISGNLMVALMAVLCLFDLWSVDKRYLADGMFQKPVPAEQQFQKSPIDEMILSDTNAYYRVLNLATDTYNDNSTSYYHKSIGGYHAAKLRRYQELIDAYLATRPTPRSEIVVLQTYVDGVELESLASGRMPSLDSIPGDSLLPVLNMLNMRYSMVPYRQQYVLPVFNPHANGNAWFVREVRYVDDADAELAGLKQLDTKHVAVADKRFKTVLGETENHLVQSDSTGTAVLTNYEANELQYDVESRDGGVLVFSEIYYPGWTCTVDGQPVEIGRVNYVLRAIRIDGGKHKVVLTFKPRSERITETIAYSALALLALLLVSLLVRSVVRARK